MAKKGDSGRTFGVSVVGLSGTEREKGNLGSGKSCLCNRFVRTHADDYFVDHISLLSQSDFSGRVVNNDHFLYWGSVTKPTEEGTEYTLHLIEQSEFIDDASFQPFKTGKTEPYIKRCCTTKLASAEKLMYVCKNQLGIEKEYEQRLMPDGRFTVDGFVCVFDVSLVQNRNPDRMIDFTIAILNNIARTKKPVVLVTTKTDEGSEILMKEAERLVNRKEFKGAIPLIETSAHDNVNVDTAFLLLAQMMDAKFKGHRMRVLPYYEAARMRKEGESFVAEGFMMLLRSQATDFRASWAVCVKKFAQSPEYLRYCEVFGQDKAKEFFRRHVKRLKDDFVSRKLQGYLDQLPRVFVEFFPDLDCICDANWDDIRDRIQDHPDFDRYFVDTPMDDAEFIETTDIRIPFDLLEYPEASTSFRNHINALQANQRRLDMRVEFKRLLEESGFITPGKPLNDVRVLLLGRDCFEALAPADAQEIYDLHQRDLIERAKVNFQELLLEHADLFYNFKSACQLSPTVPSGMSTTGSGGSSVTQEDIREIIETLQEDSRYKALDRLDQYRRLMLYQHLGFVHSPIREHCPAFPNCVDSLVERIMRSRLKKKNWVNGPGKQTLGKSSGSLTDQNTTWSLNSPWNSGDQSDEDPFQLNLVVLGSAGLADELASAMRGQCPDDLFDLDGESYSLEYKLIQGDVSMPQNAIRTVDFNPHGILCAYSSAATLDYVRASVERALLSNLEASDRLPFNLSLPIVILFAGDPQLPEEDRMVLLDEGHGLAESLQCDLVDMDCENPIPGRRVHEALVNEGLRALCTAIRNQRKSAAMTMLGSGVVGANNVGVGTGASQGSMEPPSPDGNKSLTAASGYQTLSGVVQPDIRVIMCMLCGDPFSVESVLGPLLDPSPMGSSGTLALSAIRSERSIVIEMPLGGEGKRTIEVTFSSYHGASVFKDELVHGFILVYSTKRRASLATLNAFSSNIAGMPIQIVGVTESGLPPGSAPNYQPFEFNHALIAQGNAIADRLQAHFMTSTPACQQETAFYAPFFKEVWEKKPEIEQALKQLAERGGLGPGCPFSLGGGDTGDDVEGIDSGEGTMERSDRIKKPSYPRMKNTRGMRHVASFPFNQLHHHHHHRAGSADGSGGSESLYERLPLGGEVSPGDELDDPGSPYMASDDSEVDVGIGTGARMSSPSRENGAGGGGAVGEHLVKPSQVKTRRSRAQGVYGPPSQQYPFPGASPVPPPLPSMPPPSTSSLSAAMQGGNVELHYHVSPVALGNTAISGGGGTKKKTKGVSPLAKKSSRRSSSGNSSKQQQQPPMVDYRAVQGPFMKGGSIDDPLLAPWYGGGCGAAAAGYGASRHSDPPLQHLFMAGPPLGHGTPFCGERAWVDDSVFQFKSAQDEEWLMSDPCGKGNSSKRALTLGRKTKQSSAATAAKVAAVAAAKNVQKGQVAQSLKQPGKLNLQHYTHVTETLSKLTVGGASKGGAPLACHDAYDVAGAESHRSRDKIYGGYEGKFSYLPSRSQLETKPSGPAPPPPAAAASGKSSSKHSRYRHHKEKNPPGRQAYSDSDSEYSSLERQLERAGAEITYAATKAGIVLPKDVTGSHQHPPKRHKKKRAAIPVAMPKVPNLPSAVAALAAAAAATAVESPPGTPGSSSTTTTATVTAVTGLQRSPPQEVQNKSTPTEGASPGSPSTASGAGGLSRESEGGSCTPSDEESAVSGEETFFAGRQRFRSKKRGSFKSKKKAREVPIPAPPASFVPGAKSSIRIKPTEDVTNAEPNGDASMLAIASKPDEKPKKEKPTKASKEEEKRRKEEEKLRKQEKKMDAKQKKKSSASSPPPLTGRASLSANGKTIEEMAQSPDNPIPLFMEKCIKYIEASGLDSEGIYRVPGNRAQVDALFQRFDQDGDFGLDELEIPMNAVATALKDFISKRLPPLFGPEVMDELAGKAGLNDRSLRLFALRDLVKKLPPHNFAVLKFIFEHFVKVAERSKENSMDSRNLAICFWPTLLPLEFTDMGLFERTRPHLEQAVQTMIDQFPFIFCGQEEVLRV